LTFQLHPRAINDDILVNRLFRQ